MFQGPLKPNAEHYKVTAWLLATTIKCQTNLKGHFKRAHLLKDQAKLSDTKVDTYVSIWRLFPFIKSKLWSPKTSNQ